MYDWGVVFSEDRTALQGQRRPLKGRRHALGGLPCAPARGF